MVSINLCPSISYLLPDDPQHPEMVLLSTQMGPTKIPWKYRSTVLPSLFNWINVAKIGRQGLYYPLTMICFMISYRTWTQVQLSIWEHKKSLE